MNSTVQPPSPYTSFMLKEIYDQPNAVRETLQQHFDVSTGAVTLDRCSIPAQDISRIRKITIVASGASRHAGLYGKLIIEELVGIPVEVEHASEYCYKRPLHDANSLVVVITQSGETGDTIAALRTAKEYGFRALAISNVIDSTIAREADATLFTSAGKEVAVPATKSFTTQLASLYLLAVYLAAARQSLSAEIVRTRIGELAAIPTLIQGMLPRIDERASEIAGSYYRDQTFTFLGRGVHYPIALEGALKLKEISYIHAEGYPSGELRHGPTALIDDAQPVVCIATRDLKDEQSVLRYQKTLGLLREVHEHSERLVLVVSEDDREIMRFVPDCFAVPCVSELLLPILEIVPLQLFAYHVARLNNYDVDQPRNLRKFVRAD